MKRLRTPRFIAAALAFLTVVSAPVHAAPALWVIEDHNSRIYLFGTVHALPLDLDWRSETLDDALAESTELWLEIPNLSSLGTQIGAAFLLLGKGLSMSRPLSSRLDAEQWAKLDRTARRAGLTAEQLEPMRPWLAAMMIQAGLMGTTGIGQGADLQLEAAFKKRRAPIRGFETMNLQLSIFSDLPEADELAFLTDTLDSADLVSGEFDALVAGWATGDVGKLEEMAIADMKTETPALYEALLRRRNANWANQIRDLLDGEGTIFIAVGAAHLAGPDSVQRMLAAKGITAVRR